MKTEARIRKQLLFLHTLVGISAVAGGVGLITTGGLGMPLSVLSDTIFDSFFIPGLILAFIVGGTQLLAAVAIYRRKKYAVEVSAIAAFGLLIWLFTEAMILRERNMLQVLYFGLAILSLILAFLLDNAKKIDKVLL
jgi:hypothetical protein